MRTSNGIERVNEEIRRRDRAIRIYPSDDSVMRIIGTVLLEQSEAWSTDRVYFDMKEYLEYIGNAKKPTQTCSILTGPESLKEEEAAEMRKNVRAA